MISFSTVTARLTAQCQAPVASSWTQFAVQVAIWTALCRTPWKKESASFLTLSHQLDSDPSWSAPISGGTCTPPG